MGNAGLMKGSCAGLHRCTGSVYIIDQDDSVDSSDIAFGINLKGSLQIGQSGLGTELFLGKSVDYSEKQIGNMAYI